jgi:AcrR family transcriptional regulator
VADIVRIAQTSRRTFYAQFEDRDACFLALFDRTNDQIMHAIADAVVAEATPEEQVDRALDAYLEGALARPVLLQSFVRELPALGETGAAAQAAVVERFAELLVELVEAVRRAHPKLAAQPLSRDMAVIIVGGVRELMVIAAQEGRDIRELRAAAAAAANAILSATVLSGGSFPS